VDLARTSAIARLARWLGPWTPESSRPTGIVRRRLLLHGSRPFDAWLYEPRGAAIGALLVVPGLHYLGPADPRLDRFLAILADAGLRVLCPFLPELRALRVGPSVVADAGVAFDALEALPGGPAVRPGVFSISFGSYPAIHVAASRAERVGSLLLFGGYASFEDVIRFSLGDDSGRAYDPLNRPVVFLNLLAHLDGVPADPEPLRRAWITFVRRTWGRPALKRPGALDPLAHAMAATLPSDARELFLVGTGVAPGGAERIRAALARGRADFAHLDPRPACAGIRAPVTLVHGLDDDVIPHPQSALLAEAMPSHVSTRLLLTGLYAHTGHGALDPSTLAGEARALVGILEALIDAGRAPSAAAQRV
jgi:pimeloyl-ACP methyl ester carboxylesterase